MATADTTRGVAATQTGTEGDEVCGGHATLVSIDHPHVRLISGEPPMLRLEISLYSWERGDSEIDVTMPHGGELSDLLAWALPEQRLVICSNLRTRLQEELADVFEVLSES
ncbi:MAG: hypothetical protein ACRDY7_10905 [Acidimicrobiia bacterium]